MKVGDMVRLSAYGEVRNYNRGVERSDNYYGLIIKVCTKGTYPYVVRWYNQPNGSVDSTRHQMHIRRELIYVR